MPKRFLLLQQMTKSINRLLRYGFSLAAKAKGGQKDACMGKKKEVRGYYENGIKCKKRSEQMKVVKSISIKNWNSVWVVLADHGVAH